MDENILNKNNIRKTLRYLQKNGIRHTFYAAKERMEEERKADYTYIKPEEDVLKKQKAETADFPYLFSIVVPAYKTNIFYLRQTIESVREQSYQKWELIIADAGEDPDVQKIVVYYYQEFKEEYRVRYIRLQENKGISENTNAAIEKANGDYIGLLDHDDMLAADALYEMAVALKKAEENGQHPALLYSDEDKYLNRPDEMPFEGFFIEDGKYICPNRKKKFNLDLILSNNYMCHFMMAEAGLLKKLKLRRQFDGAQDYDLILRVIKNLLDSKPVLRLPESILHIPKVLYHWRCHENSTAANTASKSYAYEAGKAALEDFCASLGWRVEVTHSLHLGFYRITYQPDIFAVRPEVGIVGGRILNRRNRIMSGIYDEGGNKLYQGLHKEYSGGAAHTASLCQDVAAVDIRCMRVCEKFRPVFEEITGIPYKEYGKQKLADISAIDCDEAGYRKLSMALGAAAAEMGYLVVWNPQITIKN